MPNDDTLRDHLRKAGRSRSRKKLAALAKSQPAAAAARRGRPATIGVKRLLRYAEWIASDYPNIANDLRQIAGGGEEVTKWYRTFSNQIEPVDVVKETASTVTVRRKRFFLAGDGPEEFFERKHNKASSYDCYFPTIQEACEHLRNEAAIEVETARTQLRVAEEQMERVEKYIASIDAILAAKA